MYNYRINKSLNRKFTNTQNYFNGEGEGTTYHQMTRRKGIGTRAVHLGIEQYHVR